MARFAKLLVFGLLVATPLIAQTTDSLFDATSSPTLEWTDKALNQLYFLSQGLDHELAACGFGVNNSVEVMITLPLRYSDTGTVVYKEMCPDSALVIWHNHPYTGPSEQDGYTKPAGLCYLGTQDVTAALASGTKWDAVSVGRGDKWSYLCWWQKDSLIQGHFAPSLPGQRKKYWSE